MASRVTGTSSRCLSRVTVTVTVSPTLRCSSWAKFSRNLAVLDGHLVPGVYDLTLAARSIVDDNDGYEVWQMANRFSEQQNEDPHYETLNLSGNEVWIHTKKLRIRRRHSAPVHSD